MYLEYSASGTIETNNIYDKIFVGKYIYFQYVRAKAEGLELSRSWATPQSRLLEQELRA